MRWNFLAASSLMIFGIASVHAAQGKGISSLELIFITASPVFFVTAFQRMVYESVRKALKG